MLTKDAVLEAVKNGRQSQCIDGRDYSRLSNFFPVSEWETFGFTVKEGVDTSEIKIIEWTEENIISQLKEDITFGIEKAEDERGISANLMYEVCKMWMWILENPLKNDDNYYAYGIHYFRALEKQYMI